MNTKSIKNKLFLKILIGVLFFITSFFQAQIQPIQDPEISGYVSEVRADSLLKHVQTLVSFGTRHTLSSTTDKKRGIGAARSWVLQKFRDYAKNAPGRMEVYLMNTDLQNDGKRIDRAVNLGNPVAKLQGTDPNDKRIFVISGHLDSRVSDVMNATSDAPGANDVASGVAAVLESARILSKSRFPATIIFVAFSGEEQGLLGSKLMAETAKKEGWQIAGVLNNDMIGNSRSSGTNLINNTQLRVFSEGLPAFELANKADRIRSFGWENDGMPRQLARQFKEIAEQFVPHLEVKLIYRNDRFLRGGDHTPFVIEGFPAIRVTEMNENYDQQHQDLRSENGKVFGDEVRFMDFDYLQKNVAANVAVLASIAKAPMPPLKVKMDVKELSNFTSLSWEKPSSNNISGYQVLIRETASAVWEKSVFTNENQILLPYSKDNYFFAVRSVDAQGNASLPVIPAIAR